MPIRHADEDGVLWDRIKDILKHGLIYLTIVFFFVLEFAPLPLVMRGIDLHMVLMAVFYWRLYRPNILPLPVLLFFGVMMDILSTNAIGLYSFLYLALGILLKYQRRHLVGQSFPIIWLCYILLFTAFSLLVASGLFLIHGDAGVFIRKALEIGLSTLVFPFVNMLLFIQNKMVTRY